LLIGSIIESRLFVPKKTDYLRQRASIKPILKTLAHVIDNTVAGRMTYLETEYGKPFTAKGFAIVVSLIIIGIFR
jgi:hypothetical protein